MRSYSIHSGIPRHASLLTEAYASAFQAQLTVQFLLPPYPILLTPAPSAVVADEQLKMLRPMSVTIEHTKLPQSQPARADASHGTIPQVLVPSACILRQMAMSVALEVCVAAGLLRIDLSPKSADSKSVEFCLGLLTGTGSTPQQLLSGTFMCITFSLLDRIQAQGLALDTVVPLKEALHMHVVEALEEASGVAQDTTHNGTLPYPPYSVTCLFTL